MDLMVVDKVCLGDCKVYLKKPAAMLEYVDKNENKTIVWHQEVKK
jgi:hypothetical protein